jgi:hypothetical protein
MHGTIFHGLKTAPPDHKDKKGKSSDRFDPWISLFAFCGVGIEKMQGNTAPVLYFRRQCRIIGWYNLKE